MMMEVRMLSNLDFVISAYDNANRLTRISQGSANVSFGYDNDSRRTSLTLPNNVTLNYGYDALSQLTGVTYMLGTNTLGNLTFAYDLAGRRTGVGGSYARTGTPQTASAATYNANNQLTQWKGATLTYDANGNLTSDGTNSYTWNARNQLVTISGGAPASFQYDPFGRRVSKTIGGTTQYLYDGANDVQDLSGTTASANLLTGGLDEYFQRTDLAGTLNFLTDALGSTLALADSTGTLQTQYTFEPFGNTSVTGTATSNSFAYNGRELDATGLYFYRARYYHPSLERFISEDPIGVAGGINLYGYVEQNPIAQKDPFGLQSAAYGWNPPASAIAQMEVAAKVQEAELVGRYGAGNCPPPTSKFPTTIGLSAGGTVVRNVNGDTSMASSATTVVVDLKPGALGAGLLANVGAQDLPSAASPGDPVANGQFAGAGYQFVVSNGQPRQLLGDATSYQISLAAVLVGGTVAYSSYPNGVYKVSFTPWPELPFAFGLGGFYKKNVPQTTFGLTTGCR